MPQVILLGILAAWSMTSVTHDVRALRVQISRLKAELAVEGAIDRAVFDRLEGKVSKPITAPNAGTNIAVRLTSNREATKVSVLRHPNIPLRRLFEIVCLSASDQHSLQAWYDRREVGSQRAEDGKRIELEVLSDLRRQSGLSMAGFMRLRPFITNYNSAERPDLSGASAPVIEAVLGDDVMARRKSEAPPLDNAPPEDRAGIVTFFAEAAEVGTNLILFRSRAVVYSSGTTSSAFRMLELASDEVKLPLPECRSLVGRT